MHSYYDKIFRGDTWLPETGFVKKPDGTRHFVEGIKKVTVEDASDMTYAVIIEDDLGNTFRLLVEKEHARFKSSLAPTPKSGFEVKKIYQNGDYTTVLWKDDTVTVVKCEKDCINDPYNAFCAALAKKVFGTNSALKRTIAEHLDVWT